MNSTIPIFLLVETQADTDRIDCYKAGADVCLTEPFCLEELLLRIAVWLRRSKKIGSGFTAQYRFEKNTIFDYNEHVLMQGPIRKNLTDRTRNLMKFFMEHPNEPLSKEQIATEVWGKYNYLISRNMDVYITKIRHYFDDCPSVNLKTLNRFGFNFLVSDMAVYINGKLVKKITQNKIRVGPRHYGYRKKITRQ
ncbi:hypothetical protein CCY01nite_07690 [Chitinophaga cymbidii]|uniref:OmpR/PhoB-type domain-containing protein n=2 Tax=Chitinophaga cymbidii TaxID=1096750 RepID=A0A512RFM1_9BACT|nr:hypothetical protein CCY01nite_07690 [Chitinophaga cymbidii]